MRRFSYYFFKEEIPDIKVKESNQGWDVNINT